MKDDEREKDRQTAQDREKMKGRDKRGRAENERLHEENQSKGLLLYSLYAAFSLHSYCIAPQGCDFLRG